MPAGLEFEEPAEVSTDRVAWGNKGDDFFKALDLAWNKGILPQRYLKVPR